MAGTVRDLGSGKARNTGKKGEGMGSEEKREGEQAPDAEKHWN